LKYFLCVALSLVIGAVQVLLPLEAAPSTPEDPEAQISFASYVLVHQGFYALGAGFFELCIFEACLPAKGLKTHLATAANLLGAVMITWSVYAFAHAVDRHSIQHSLIHTIGPLVLVIPVMLRYLWRAKCLHEREVRAYNRRTNSLKLRTDAAAVSAVAAALVGPGERVGASPEPLLGDQQDYGDSSFTAGAASFKEHVSPPPKSSQSSFGGVLHSVAPSFYPVPPSPFWRSDVFFHWVSSVGIHVILLHVFFFCQWATLTFKKVEDSSLLQFGVLLLFQGVMFLAKVTLKFLTERMDFRPLPALTRAEARIRPKLTCMGDALMQLFFFNFYRQKQEDRLFTVLVLSKCPKLFFHLVLGGDVRSCFDQFVCVLVLSVARRHVVHEHRARRNFRNHDDAGPFRVCSRSTHAGMHLVMQWTHAHSCFSFIVLRAVLTVSTS
jgi:hypothetical protein